MFSSASTVRPAACHVCRRNASRFSAENVLGPANRQRTVTTFESMPSIRLQPKEPLKKAAVLIPLCIVDGKVSLLYTLRAPHLKSHRGQVSFPGGMIDPRDHNLQDTAVRETREELGIGEDLIDIWGCGKLVITRAETCILPVVGQIKGTVDLHKLKVNKSEVEEVFSVPLEDLCSPAKLGHTQFRGAYSAPVFLAGRRRIWGLTALITNLFLRSLVSREAYAHQFRYIPSVCRTQL